MQDEEARRIWSAKAVERLIGLWDQGLSARAMAAALGDGFSRGAVVGKLHRLGLRRTGAQRHQAKAAGARASGRKQRAREAADGPLCRPAPLPAPRPCAVVPRLVDLMELGRTGCRWPYGLDEIRYCGHRALGGGPYCEAHRAIAYEDTLPPLTLEALAAEVRRARLRAA